MEQQTKGYPCCTGYRQYVCLHCGAGFASGTQEVAFFYHERGSVPLCHGNFGDCVLHPMELSREFGLYNYKQWSDKIYSPYHKVFSIIWEIAYLSVGFIATSACLAVGGELLLQKLNIPYYIGIVIVFVVVTIICMYGAKAVVAASTAMSIALIIMVVIVTVAGIASGWENSKQMIADRVIYTSVGDAWWRMLVYADISVRLSVP